MLQEIVMVDDYSDKGNTTGLILKATSIVIP